MQHVSAPSGAAGLTGGSAVPTSLSELESWYQSPQTKLPDLWSHTVWPRRADGILERDNDPRPFGLSAGESVAFLSAFDALLASIFGKGSPDGIEALSNARERLQDEGWRRSADEQRGQLWSTMAHIQLLVPRSVQVFASDETVRPYDPDYPTHHARRMQAEARHDEKPRLPREVDETFHHADAGASQVRLWLPDSIGSLAHRAYISLLFEKKFRAAAREAIHLPLLFKLFRSEYFSAKVAGGHVVSGRWTTGGRDSNTIRWRAMIFHEDYSKDFEEKNMSGFPVFIGAEFENVML